MHASESHVVRRVVDQQMMQLTQIGVAEMDHRHRFVIEHNFDHADIEVAARDTVERFIGSSPKPQPISPLERNRDRRNRLDTTMTRES